MPAWYEIDRYLIISSDAHCGASPDEYRGYPPRSLHGEFEAWRAGFDDPWAHIPTEKAMGMWSEQQRMSHMDEDGIAAEVLLPNTTPPFFPTLQLFATVPSSMQDYRLRWAGIQAHNRWLVDFTAGRGRRCASLRCLLRSISSTTFGSGRRSCPVPRSRHAMRSAFTS